jgi:hypothetical protein
VFQRRSVLLRVCIAAFALWLPAATGKGGKATCVAAAVTGKGGKATCVAAASYAKSMNERPHLSCHGENGARKSCCCKGEQALRAAACDCHDGQRMFGAAAYDPMLARWSAGPAGDFALASPIARDRSMDRGRFSKPPDPPPPKQIVSFYS